LNPELSIDYAGAHSNVYPQQLWWVLAIAIQLMGAANVILYTLQCAPQQHWSPGHCHTIDGCCSCDTGAHCNMYPQQHWWVLAIALQVMGVWNGTKSAASQKVFCILRTNGATNWKTV
jgi:hypothetical protein